MGKPAARLTDMHTCPMVTPGTPPIPHVGGPITGPGCPTVLVGGLPAAVIGDMSICVGPPDTIAMGSTGVFICGKPAARMGDNTAHGGIIVQGCPTVLIGETGGGGGGGGGASMGGSSGGSGGSGDGAGADTEGLEGNPRHAEGVLGEMSPLDIEMLSGMFKNASDSGTPFCRVCEKEAARLEAEKKAQQDLAREASARDWDRERDVRKKAAEKGYPLMEAKCPLCQNDEKKKTI